MIAYLILIIADFFLFLEDWYNYQFIQHWYLCVNNDGESPSKNKRLTLTTIVNCRIIDDCIQRSNNCIRWKIFIHSTFFYSSSSSSSYVPVHLEAVGKIGGGGRRGGRGEGGGGGKQQGTRHWSLLYLCPPTTPCGCVP